MEWKSVAREVESIAEFTHSVSVRYSSNNDTVTYLTVPSGNSNRSLRAYQRGSLRVSASERKKFVNGSEVGEEREDE